MNENVNVCITPKGDKPVLHFSQFDNENVFTVTVLADDGESAAVLTGLDIEFRLRKTDSHVVTIAPESVADNVITFKTTEQMCACCGQNIATVTLMKDDMVISTLDILVDIQRDILSGGLTSESDIRNLTAQIEQIVPEVVGDDYYTKTEVDELIDDIPTFDPSNYYDKNYINTMYWTAQQCDYFYYRKTYINEHYYTKDDVYTKSDVYNKIETDNLLSAKMDNIGYHGIVDEAAVISFTTDCNAPLDIIKGKITPVQSGTGTPSPQNVRPISGFSNSVIRRTGKNLLNGDEFADNFAGASGYSKDTVNKTVSFANALPTTNYHQIIYSGIFKPNTRYTFIFNYTAVSANRSLRIGYTDGTNGEFYFETNGTKTSLVVTSASGKTIREIYLSFFANGFTTIYYDEIGIFEGVVTLADFEPYNGQTATVNFGQTVYGGQVDVTNGKLTITHDNIASYNGESINEPWLSSMDTYVPNTTPTTGAQVVYPLATPIEIDTTPETVSSIAGDNNIFIDTGNMTEIAYFENAEDNLIKLIKACQI